MLKNYDTIFLNYFLELLNFVFIEADAEAA